MPDIPRSLQLALTWEAVSSGSHIALRDLQGDDEPHLLGGAPLVPALAELAPHAVWCIVPAPADPQGLPPGIATTAIEAGEALVLLTSDGARVLIPQVQVFGSELEPGAFVRWRLLDASGMVSPSSSPGESGLLLLQTMREAIDELTRLDVAQERPDLREAFLDLALPVPASLVDALEPLEERRRDLLLRALRLLAIVDLASQDHGAAVTLGQITSRTSVMRDLDRAARGAVAVGSYRRLTQPS